MEREVKCQLAYTCDPPRETKRIKNPNLIVYTCMSQTTVGGHTDNWRFILYGTRNHSSTQFSYFVASARLNSEC